MEKNNEISNKDQEEKPIKHPLLDGKYFQIVKRKKKAITCVCMHRAMCHQILFRRFQMILSKKKNLFSKKNNWENLIYNSF